MCCKGNTRTNHCHGHHTRVESRPNQCGCGCMGKGQTAVNLENYKAYLKAELKSVEDRIANLTND